MTYFACPTSHALLRLSRFGQRWRATLVRLGSTLQLFFRLRLFALLASNFIEH